MPASDWENDPTEVARHQAWEDAGYEDGLLYRQLLDERGIQHPDGQPLPDDPKRRSASSRVNTPEAQNPISWP